MQNLQIKLGLIVQKAYKTKLQVGIVADSIAFKRLAKTLAGANTSVSKFLHFLSSIYK